MSTTQRAAAQHDFRKGCPGPVRAPQGTEIEATNWLLEAPRRMLLNNLDPEVAERPDELVVYGGTGRAARSWACVEAIFPACNPLSETIWPMISSSF